jgi:hypothetical protein
VVRLADKYYPFNTSIPLEIPLKTPSSKLGLRCRFALKSIQNSEYDLILEDVRPKEDQNGYQLIIHDPFEMPSHHSFNTYTQANTTIDYFIVPKITSFDKSLAAYGADK